MLWLQGANCSGCSVSLLNSYRVLPLSLLTKHISLKFHQTLSTTQGQQAVDTVNETIARGGYILVVEGAVPVGHPDACTFAGENFGDLLDRAVRAADAVVAVGACAMLRRHSLRAAQPHRSRRRAGVLHRPGHRKPLINVPGCPPHPDWMVGTIVHVLTTGIPALDSDLRPLAVLLGKYPRPLPAPEHSMTRPTDRCQGCMENVGCRGESTYGDCPTRGWNGIRNNCITSRGCASVHPPTFAKDGAFYREPPVE